MEWTTTAEVALIGGAVGLGAYCFSCAAHVWRARNAPQRPAPARSGFGSAIRRVGGLLLIAAVLGVVLSAGWWAAVRHEGLVDGDGLFTARRPPSLEVVHLTTASRVEEGELLVRYASPDTDAQIAVLELRRQSLAAETEVLHHQVLVVDPEIAQMLTENNVHQRTLRTTLNDLVLEKERLDRDAFREQMGRRDEINRREGELRKLGAEAEQARSVLDLSRDEYARLASLRDRKAISEQEFAEKASELEAARIEVRKIEEQLQQTREQKAELKQGLEDFQRLSQQQANDLVKTIATVREHLEELAQERDELQQTRSEDLDRARRHRDERLKKAAIEMAQTEKQLAAERSKLQVRAPFTGRVAYRASSPGTANPQEALVVLAPPDGLRLRVRLPRWMKSPLRQAGGISCELLEDLQRDEPRRFIERRFAGSLAAWTEMDAHPGQGLADLTCEPPAEAVRLLASGEQIAARLVWRPPLYSVPLFRLSGLLAALTGTAWALSRARRNPAPADRRTNGHRLEHSHSVCDGVLTEFGGEGALLGLLGSQLREMTLRRELDDNVIAAAEWALMRHRDRAVRLLSAGVGDGANLCDHLDALAHSVVEDQGTSNGHTRRHRIAMLRRLIAVLQAAAPDGSYETICRIKRKLPRPAADGCNSHHRHVEVPDPASEVAAVDGGLPRR